MTKGRVPPHNLEAEQSALGAAMLTALACETVVAETRPVDFYSPQHQAIRYAIGSLWADGMDLPDPVAVANELERSGELAKTPNGKSYLVTLQASVPATSNVNRYCRIITDHATLRRLIERCGEITDTAYGVPDDVRGTVELAQVLLGSIEMPIDASLPSPTIADLLGEAIFYDWVTKGLIERGDRLIVTGGEGGGKSTLLRQIAVCLAAGIHPFTGTRVPPARVLYIDAENPKGIMQREFHKLHAKTARTIDDDLLRYERRPEGLDLLGRRDVQWLYERVAANRPDVLIIGPLYKLHNDDENDARPARKIQHVLDTARTRYGNCALILEAHSPHGPKSTRELRPRGHSVWLGWPEFGYGIRPGKKGTGVYLFEPWRGSREERDWPGALRRGGAWPWTETTLDDDAPPPPQDEDF